MSIKINSFNNQNYINQPYLDRTDRATPAPNTTETAAALPFDRMLSLEKRVQLYQKVDAALLSLRESCDAYAGIRLNSPLAYSLGLQKPGLKSGLNTDFLDHAVASQSQVGSSALPVQGKAHTPSSSRYTSYCPEHTGSDGNSNSGTLKCDPALHTIFAQAARATGVDIKLIKAVSFAESGFRTHLVCSNGASGAMMLMPATMKEYGVTDGTDPVQNIMAGAALLADKLNEFDGNLSLALAAYNAGSGAVRKYGGIPPYSETQNYVRKVTGFYNGD